ncbi:MAG: MFS transporter [Coxiellaceae bacterium]|nr:MAG: MFS transporter [Coxiellaceae bacterium]
MLQIKLLAQRDFLLVNLARISHAFSYMSVLFLMGLLLQNVLGHPANVAGLILLYMTIPSGIFGPIAGKWSDRIGTRIPQILGMLALFIGCIFLTQIQHFPMSTMIALGLSLLGISAGLFLPCSSITAVSVVPKEQTGMATGVFYTNSFIGTTLGIAISGSILAISSTHYLLESIRTNKLVFTPQQLSVLKETASGIQPISAITQYFPQQMILELSQMTHQAFMTGFITAISTCAGLAAIGTFLVFMLKKSQNIQ